MSDIWDAARNCNAEDLYQAGKNIPWGNDAIAASFLATACEKMTLTYNNIVDDKNEYLTDIQDQLDEITELQKELELEIQRKEAEQEEILTKTQNEELSEEDSAKVQELSSDMDELSKTFNAKIDAKKSEINTKKTESEHNNSKEKIATDYGNTAVEKGQVLAETEIKDTFLRRLFGTTGKREKAAGERAVEAGEELLEQVGNVNGITNEISSKTKNL